MKWKIQLREREFVAFGIVNKKLTCWVSLEIAY